MSLTRRSRLAVLVSLGPTLTTADPGLETSAGPAGAPATDFAPGATLSWALSMADATPPTDPWLLVLVEPPLLQPASNRAESATTAVRLRGGRRSPSGPGGPNVTRGLA